MTSFRNHLNLHKFSLTLCICTHFRQMFPLYTPKKHQKTQGFLVFKGVLNGNISQKLINLVFLSLNINLPVELYSLRSLNFSPMTPCVHKMQTHAKNFQQTLKDSERALDHFRDTSR